MDSVPPHHGDVLLNARFNVGATEYTLKHLVKQKQDKVEEIKKKTGYYSTRDLLEKYDEALRKGVRVSLRLA